MKIIGFVPIKLNNERVPNKNLLKFYDNVHLTTYVLEKLNKVKLFDELYVYCSDKTIINYIPKNSNIIFLQRPGYLDTQKATTYDIIYNFCKQIKVNKTDILSMCFVTSPFLEIKTYIGCINKLVLSNYDSCFTVKRIFEFLWNEKQPLNYNLNNVPRSQDLPITYVETTGLYVFRKDVFDKYNARIGENPYLYNVSTIESIDINYPDDWKIADSIYITIKNDNASR